MSQSSDYILLGNISGVHGIKGWLKVFSYTSPRLQITEYSQWYIQSKNSEEWQPMKVVAGRKQGKNIIAMLDGIDDRNQVEALIGSKIAIQSIQLEKLSNKEYYWKDLIGLSVETTEGEELGKVDWLFDTGSNDVVVIKDKSGSAVKERMVPFLLDDVIKTIDLENSLMVVDWDPEF